MPVSHEAWSGALSWAGRGTLCLVFLTAGVPKLLDPAAFATSIDNYHLLPLELTRWAAAVLPTLEICIALSLLSPALWRGALLLSIGLLVMFSVAMAQAMMREIDLDCGCFGNASDQAVSLWSIGRNLSLCALAGWSLWITRMSQSPAPATLKGS